MDQDIQSMRVSARPTSFWERLVPSSEALSWIGLGGLLLTLEYLGRATERDLHDLLFALTLWAALALLILRRQQQSLQRLKQWLRVVGSWLNLHQTEHGFDLRGQPTLPPRMPPMLLAAALVTVVAWLGSVAAWWLFPEGWRTLGIRTSYVIYLLIFSLVWLGLMATMMLGLYLTFRMMDDQLQKWSGRPTQELRSTEFILLMAYLMTLMTVASWVPLAVPLTIHGLLATLCCMRLVRRGPTVPALLWRSAPGRTMFSMRTTSLMAWMIGITTVALGTLILAACGGHLISQPDKQHPMLLTHVLGMSTAWLLPGVGVWFAIRLFTVLGRDPARMTPKIVSVFGTNLSRAERKIIRDCLARAGFRTSFPEKRPKRGTVGLWIVAPEASQATEFQPDWPLPVSLADLIEGKVLERLTRRDELSRRRIAIRGFRFLLRKAAKQRRRGSGGFLFAPHWWMIEGLQREESQRPTRSHQPKVLRPTYQQLYPPRVRQYWHEVLRRLEIDLIFIEDGVSAKACLTLIRRIFEVYDLSGGKGPLEERQLPLLPQVRVQIDGWSPGEMPQLLRRSSWEDQEREYHDLHRARVMMIFRDDTGEREEEPVPYDHSWEPSPGLGIR